MKNKMAKKKKSLKTIDSKNQSKQTRKTDRIMNMENILMVARWEGVVGE